MSPRDDRTEKPTPRRRKKARAEGQIARSTELVAWSALVAATFALPLEARSAGHRLQALTNQAAAVTSRPTSGGAVATLALGLRDVMVIVAPVGLAALIIGFAVGTAQMGRPALSPLKPKFSKLSPKAGFKRVFSTHGPLEAAKSLLRLLVILAVTFPVVRRLIDNPVNPQDGALSGGSSLVVSSSLHLLRIVAAFGALVAVADYAYVRHRTNKSMMMTKQEVKDEFRDSEGDPMLKSRRRAMARRLSRHRMMAALSSATAVVVNPTHYAVALAYTSGDPAPKVVAKGVDDMALRIRKVAMSHGVPIIEDPPLARALHAACEIEDRIPGNLFLATARLLAFVYQLPDLAKKYPSSHFTPANQLPVPTMAERGVA